MANGLESRMKKECKKDQNKGARRKQIYQRWVKCGDRFMAQECAG